MIDNVLTNKEQFPSTEIIEAHIGIAKPLWNSFFDYIHSEHPDFSEEWRFYNDGKRWLLKVTRKSKTIFWLTIQNGSFLTTFYFAARLGDAIEESPISEELKQQFRNGEKYNKIKGISITFKNNEDVEYAKSLIELKCSLK